MKCRKCGDEFPVKIKINGKDKSLCSRKFCLKCSPYKGHNTKPDDPSRSPNRTKHYSGWSEKAKKSGRDNIYKRGQRRKKELIAISGGACIKCGYNKSEKALTFHHRVAADKLFALSVNNLWSKKWTTLLEEHKKCDLLCMNCHAEIEDEIKRRDPKYYKNQFNIEN